MGLENRSLFANHYLFRKEEIAVMVRHLRTQRKASIWKDPAATQGQTTRSFLFHEGQFV